MKVYNLFEKHRVPYLEVNTKYDGIKIMSTSIGWMTNISNSDDKYTPFYAMNDIDLCIILNAEIDTEGQLRDPLGPIINENKMSEKEIIDDILKEYKSKFKTELDSNFILQDWFESIKEPKTALLENEIKKKSCCPEGDCSTCSTSCWKQVIVEFK